MLKLAVDKIDDIEEPLRALYEEKDGKFRLKVDGLENEYVPREVLKKANDESAARRKELEPFKKLGKTEEEIRQLIEAAEKAEEIKAKRAGDFEKLRESMTAEHAKQLKAKEDALAKKDKAIERYLIDAQATAALAAAKGSADLLLPHVQRATKVFEEENGDYVVKVIDAKGEPRFNGKGEPMSIADLVSEMRQSESFGRAFEGSGQTGSGMRPGTSPSGATSQKTITRADFNQLPPVEQRAKALGGFTIVE